jgi:hypothetical protein
VHFQGISSIRDNLLTNKRPGSRGHVNRVAMAMFPDPSVENFVRSSGTATAINHGKIVTGGRWQSLLMSANKFNGASCGPKIAPQIAA